jgi:hypothetical protein
VRTLYEHDSGLGRRPVRISTLTLADRSKSDLGCVPFTLPLDRRILQSSEEGYVEAHVIFPGGIIGEAHGPVLAGSTFLKLLIQLATRRQPAC